MDKVIELFSNKVIRCFIKQNIIDESQKDVYKYGIIVASQATITMISMLIIGLIFDLFFENLCFIIVFKILRKFSGGLHSKKFLICFFVSILLNILVLFTYRLFVLVHNFMIVVPVEFVSSLILVLLSPVKCKNKDISKNESKVFKLIVTIICITVFLGSVFFVSKKILIVYFFCMAVLLDCFFVGLGSLRTS